MENKCLLIECVLVANALWDLRFLVEYKMKNYMFSFSRFHLFFYEFVYIFPRSVSLKIHLFMMLFNALLLLFWKRLIIFFLTPCDDQ